MNQIELKLLKPVLTGAGILALCGLIACAIAWWQYADARQMRQDDVDQLAAKVIEVARLRESLNYAMQNVSYYQSLVEAGVIGDFHKTRELDRFEASLRGHDIGVRGFALSSLQPVSVPNPHNFQQYDPGRYQLTFSAEVLHERQFGQLTSAIRSSLNELGILESCTLKRNESASAALRSETTLIDMLNARCTVSWYVFTPVQVDPLGGGAAPPPSLEE